MIQGCFLGGGFGRFGSSCSERWPMGADGAADHRAPGSEGLNGSRQLDFRRRRAVDRAHWLALGSGLDQHQKAMTAVSARAEA